MFSTIVRGGKAIAAEQILTDLKKEYSDLRPWRKNFQKVRG